MAALRGAGLLATALLAVACSLGEGDGDITSNRLVIPGCWDGPFELLPNFFAAMPYRRTLTIRVQHGGDIEEVSDGAIILIDDIDEVRAAIAKSPGGAPFRVALQPSLVPPGFPIVADPNPAIIHLALYLQRACHAQNSTVYAISGTMTFRALFNGDPNETDTAELLTDADFSNVLVGNPNDHPPGDPTIQDISNIQGFFKFYFQRGQPAQPFP